MRLATAVVDGIERRINLRVWRAMYGAENYYNYTGTPPPLWVKIWSLSNGVDDTVQEPVYQAIMNRVWRNA